MGFEHRSYSSLSTKESWNQIWVVVDMRRIRVWIGSGISSRSQCAIEINHRTQPTYSAYQILNLSIGSLEVLRNKGI